MNPHILMVSTFVWMLLAIISGLDGNAAGLIASLYSFFITLIYVDEIKKDNK